MLKDVIIRTKKTAFTPAYTLWSWGIVGGGSLGDGRNFYAPTQVGSLTDWEDVSAGNYYANAVKTDGTLWGWGNNTTGNIGDGSSTNRSSPVQVGTSTDWSKVFAGSNASFATKTDDTLWCWGTGSTVGSLGFLFPNSPVPVGDLTTWNKIGTNTTGGFSIKTDGTLWAWGGNNSGQVGDGSDTKVFTVRSSPVQIGADTNWLMVGKSFASSSIAIRTNGTLWAWGSNTFGQLGNGNKLSVSSPIQVGTDNTWKVAAMGLSFTMAIKSNGTLWSWGGNGYGELGDNISTAVSRSSPAQVGSLTNWLNVACGGNHVLALKTDGTLWAWGRGINGQIGDNTAANKSSPVQIGALTTWDSITAGLLHSIARRTDGTLWGWGINGDGRLGTDNITTRSSPVQIGLTTNDWTTKISAGGSYTMAIKSNGTLWGWGFNGSSQLGDGTTTSRSSPVQIGSMNTWGDVVANSDQTFAVTTTNSLYAWGNNASSTLPLNHNVLSTASTIFTPTQLGTSKWTTLSAWAHSLAVQTDGTLWSWGANSAGQIGDGTNNISKSRPVQIGSDANWQKVSAGLSHSMAIKSDGTLWAWGGNTSGQMGLGAVTPTLGPSTFDWLSVETTPTSHTIALKSNGTMWGWGDRSTGASGIPLQTDPVRVTSTSDWSVANPGSVPTYGHSLFVKTDGTLWTSGVNSDGQLGLGDTRNRSSPVQIGSLTNWLDARPGFSSLNGWSIGLKTDGTLWAWGSNSNGQLGDGTTTNRSSPVQIGTRTGWASIATGGLHAFATRTDGTIWGWGANLVGQLGDGTAVSRSSPVQVGALTTWSKVSAGGGHTMAIRTDGTLWGWGANSGRLGTNDVANRSSPVQVGTDTNWSEVSAAAESSHAVKTDGTLWGWGTNTTGNLGDGTVVAKSSPVQIGALTNWSKVNGAPYSAGGTFHTLAVKTDGTLWAWGVNGSYQLGDGTQVNRSSPVQIGLGTNWKDAKAGVSYSMAVTTAGTMWAWGNNSNGQTGSLPYAFGSTTTNGVPIQIGTSSNWTKISTSDSASVAVASDGTLWTWGQNSFGELGVNLTTSHVQYSPIQVGALTNWSDARVSTAGSGGNRFMVAVKTDGTLWSWGANIFGFLGDNTTVSRSSPVQIGAMTNWKSVDPGQGHTMAIKTDGTLWGWGSNSSGELGTGNVTRRSSPIQVGALSNWSVASAGGSHTMAIKTDGTLWAWGSDDQGQLGVSRPVVPTLASENNWLDISAGLYSGLGVKTDGSLWAWGLNTNGELGLNDTVSRSSPVQVGASTDWSKISVGGFHAMALKTDGSLWTWGQGTQGQLGLGVTRSSPVQVGALTNWSSISAGRQYSFAIKTDGTLWAWGLNTNGQLGLNNTSSATSPVQVGTGTDWAYVSAAGSHTMAVKTNGTLWGWGDNTNGKIGDGTVVNRSSPIQIGSLTNWSMVSAARSNSYAIRTDGTMWSWGANNSYQMGDSGSTARSSPVQIGTAQVWSVVSGSRFEDGSSVGGSHAMAIGTNGTLWGWGWNSNGEIGVGNLFSASSPVQIGSSSWTKVSAGGGDWSIGISDLDLYGWGRNASGQLAINSTLGGSPASHSSPIQVGASSNWSNVYAHGTRTYAIKTNGTLWAWGANGDGNIGTGNNVSRYYSPVQIGSATNWTYFSADANSGVRSDGSIRAWGDNASGRLGNGYIGNVSPRSSPVQIGEEKWSDVSAGDLYTVAIKTDGTLWGAGWNSEGRIAQPSNINSVSYFTQIGSLNGWKSISVAASTSYATRTDNSLWAWGRNANGTVGNGALGTAVSSPVQIGSGYSWTSVPHGVVEFASAVSSNGSIWTWGFGATAYTGWLGYPIYNISPVQISGFTNISKFSGGTSNSMVIKTDGTLWAWGTNVNAVLGLNDLSGRASPVQVESGTLWKEISRDGRLSTLGIKTDGTLWAWGNNSFYQLGDGTTVSRSRPIQISSLNTWTKARGLLYGGAGITSDNTLWVWGATNQNTPWATLGLPIYPFRVGSMSNWTSGMCGASGSFISLKTDGTLWAWGINTDGVLGTGDTINRSSPVQIGTDTNWSSVSIGFFSSYALKTNGTLWGWGRNTSGQLGDGTQINRSSPVQIGTLTTWSYVEAGGDVGFAIRTNGTLWAWGINSSGQLGLNNTINRSSPVQVGADTNWSSISGGSAYAVALKTNGTLWGWGTNASGQIGDRTTVAKSSPVQIGTDSNWIRISASFAPHTMAVKSNGTLWSWGINTNGQLGHSNTVNRSSPTQIGTDTDWSLCSTSGSSSFAIKTNGSLWSWGANGAGQLGSYSTVQRSSPVQVGTSTDWSKIFVSRTTSSFGLKTDGTLWSWGTNTNGELGLGHTISGNATIISVPIQVGGYDPVWKELPYGDLESFGAIKTDGTLWTWGPNTAGQIGDNTVVAKSSPVQVAGSWSIFTSGGNSRFAIKTDGSLWAWGDGAQGSIGNLGIAPSTPSRNNDALWSVYAAGNSGFSAIKTNGTLWGWGSNTMAVVGDGTLVDRSSPVQVGSGTDWRTLSRGNGHTIAIKTNGTMWSWGTGTSGQLGDNSLVTKSSPVQVGSLTDWEEVRCGTNFSLARKTDGTIWSWGVNTSGQLGINDTTTRSSPVQIGNISTWRRIAVSSSTSFAIRSDGTLWAWGLNTSGQIGDGTTTARSSPVQIGNLTNWSSLIETSNSNGAHMMAIKNDGTLWGWGLNSGGLLGDGTVVNRSSPVQIGTLGVWIKVSTGTSHTLAIRSDRSLWAWGSNASYQLGDGTNVNKSSPVQIGSNYNWESVTAGFSMSGGIKTDGTSWAWGSDIAGATGRGFVYATNVSRSSPVQIGEDSWRSVRATLYSVVAVRNDGTLWAWGVGSSSQIGDGSQIGRSAPVQIGMSKNWIEPGSGTEQGFGIFGVYT